MIPEFLQQIGVQASSVIQPLPGEQNPLEESGVIRTGRIKTVDAERWVVSVDFEGGNQQQDNMPIISQYFNHREGQGLYFIPEIGARCVLAYVYDTWAIIGYIPPNDPAHSDELAKASRKTQTLTDEFIAGATPGTRSTDIIKSYRNHRESDMGPGDCCIKTKAYNKSKWFTTGNILHESTKNCLRLYSANKNLIQDICNNYTMRTPGGFYRWTTDYITAQSDTRRDVKARTDDKYSVWIELTGHDASVFWRKARHHEKITGSSFPYLPQESTEYLPEHFWEHVRWDGRWERRVNHNFEEMVEDSIVRTYTDPKSMYYELVTPEGEWTKKINWIPSPTETINFYENVQPDGSWEKKISISGSSQKYKKNIDKDGNIYEASEGQKIVEIRNNIDVTSTSGNVYIRSPGGIVHINP